MIIKRKEYLILNKAKNNVLLFVFLGRALTLDGASDGVKAYIGELPRRRLFEGIPSVLTLLLSLLL